MQDLTLAEQSRLTKLEDTITKTQGAFVACGQALSEILESKLYRQTYSTFNEYCEQRWGWKRNYAYRLIEAAEVVTEILYPNGIQMANERQVRALVAVHPSYRTKVVKAAIKSGNVTANGIEQAAQEVLAKQIVTVGPVTELDKTGHPIPDPALPYWARSCEVEEVLAHISRAKSAVKSLQDTKDPMYAEVNMNGTYADLCNAYNSFKLAIPHAVCPICDGLKPKGCSCCGGRGVISKFRFETAIPQEVKDARAEAVKKFTKPILGKKSTSPTVAA